MITERNYRQTTTKDETYLTEIEQQTKRMIDKLIDDNGRQILTENHIEIDKFRIYFFMKLYVYIL